MCIKAGDIGHSALPWELHEQWSERVTREFWEQGDEERSLGLAISALCDKESVGDIGKSQKGFLEFVCLPLFEELSKFEVDNKSASKDASDDEKTPTDSRTTSASAYLDDETKGSRSIRTRTAS